MQKTNNDFNQNPNDDGELFNNLELNYNSDNQNNNGEEIKDIETQDLTSEKDSNNKSITISKTKIALLKKILQNMKENFESINNLLSGVSMNNEEQISIGQLADEKFIIDDSIVEEDKDEENRIIEGVFDGESMIGPDGKQYSVPANYASKSKLIEGDIMKLTITNRGTFVYKQIGPIERSRVIAKLNQDSNGNYYATLDNKKWRLLPASVTYYKGQDGDEIILLVPKEGESKWAAVENIVKKGVSEE